MEASAHVYLAVPQLLQGLGAQREWSGEHLCFNSTVRRTSFVNVRRLALCTCVMSDLGDKAGPVRLYLLENYYAGISPLGKFFFKRGRAG